MEGGKVVPVLRPVITYPLGNSDFADYSLYAQNHFLRQRSNTMAQSPQHDTNAELEAVKADLAQLRGDMTDLLKAVKEQNEQRVQQKAHQARDGVKAAFDEGLDTLNSGYEQVRAQSRERVDDAEQVLSNHPLTSVMAAFGIGFVVAKVLNGGRH
ncbi:hypothetical protein P8631_06950 [Guyparkeria sp. 1SP6A2]|nr:hypothetical protein [Guyparkeria sp. 1SP6A2]